MYEIKVIEYVGMLLPKRHENKVWWYVATLQTKLN